MEIFNKTENGISLDVNDFIGFWGVSHQSIKEQLDLNQNSDISLNISSLGGDVNHAFAIYNLLQSHKGRVVANIYGDAASAATLIALGADEIRMADNVFFMIHNAWTMAVGESGDLRKTADLLDKVNEQIVDVYKKKTGLRKSEIKQLMADETWFTAKEAKEKGFIDKVTESSEILNRNENVIMNSTNKEIAKSLINKINNNNQKPMELNEQKVADSVFAKIKDFFATKEKETAITNEANEQALKLEEQRKELEKVQAEMEAKKLEIENSKKEAEKLAEEVAKLQASKTEVEAKVDTEEVETKDSLEYAGIIKNIVKKHKNLN